MAVKRIFLAAAAALAIAGTALGQAVFIPTVPSVNPGIDLVHIIPRGAPVSGNQYVTVAQLLTGATYPSGMRGAPLELTNFRTGGGIGMAATAAAGVFGVSLTSGTSEVLIGEAANLSTKTDTAGFELVIPASYVAGQNITLTVNCNYNLGSGTIGTHTLAAHAYPVGANGAQSTDLVTTAAQSVPSSAGNLNFTVSGVTLAPGSRLWLTFVMVIQDTGGSNITGQINSVTVS